MFFMRGDQLSLKGKLVDYPTKRRFDGSFFFVSSKFLKRRHLASISLAILTVIDDFRLG
jgi:hypothetical protein